MAVFSGEKLLCIRGERVVFSGLNFLLDAGGALVLIGPNGSGKSSLLRLMAGLLKPAVGHMDWDGEPVMEDRESHSGRLHYVGHHDAVKPVLTVAENLRFWASIRSDATEVEANISKALDIFDIEKLRDVPGRFLSAGQKRRVNLGRIVAAPAPVWLLDEPQTALDKATIKRLEQMMADHRAGGGMIILSTHLDINIGDHQTLNLSDFQASGASAFAGSIWDLDVEGDNDDHQAFGGRG